MMLANCQLEGVACKGLACFKPILKPYMMPRARKAACFLSGWLVKNGARVSAGKELDTAERMGTGCGLLRYMNFEEEFIHVLVPAQDDPH